jgi:2',3'-cyclic-nucleotide 2'-phosphodiesterase (5'-nucleotidase family)
MAVFDSGNFSDNPTPAGDVKTGALVEAMSRLGYAAVNVGERELVSGYDAFVAKTKSATYPFVSTNLVRQDTKEPVFKPYVIVEAKGKTAASKVRIGVLGVVRFNPVFQKAGPDKSNVIIAPPLEMLQKYLPEVRDKVDVVVLLASVHKDDARTLVRSVPGVDLVLGAFSGIVTSQDETEGPVALRYVGNQGRYIGESRLSLSPQRRIVSGTHYMHLLTSRYPSDEPMVQFVQRAMDKAGPPKSTAAAAPAH